MSLPDHLNDGYERFRAGHFAEQQRRYRELAEKGQAPKTLVIACCDSRADPALIFDASPGELFVVRNVAALVPPCLPDGDYHGTSAAIEFAITGLEVSHILVLGHAQCGGIAAALERDLEYPESDSFITKWMGIAQDAKAKVQAASPEDPQRALEEAAVARSLENLLTFPFIEDRVKAGKLKLHGAHFGIADGHLTVVD